MIQETLRYKRVPPDSINRHSIREYNYIFALDKTLDGCPPFYHLSVVDYGVIGRTILVDGEEYWGSGLSWKVAEVKAFKAIELHEQAGHSSEYTKE